MSLRRACCVLAAAVAVVATVSVPRAQEFPKRDQIRRLPRALPGRYIVKLRGADDPEAVGHESALVHRGRLRHAYRHALRGFAIELTESAAQALAADPRVEYVQEDGVTTGNALTVRTGAADLSWGLDRVDQRGAVLDGSYRYGSDGTGVNVYVIDTGIRLTHQEFGGRAFAAFNATDDGISAGIDCNGHGTHVAGIAGGNRSGVASGVTIYSVKALGCNSVGTWSDLIEAINWVVANHRKPAVINASIGGPFNDATANAIEAAVAAGITYVGAAGNQGADACSAIPGGAPNAITVGNSTSSDERSSDSNYGSCVTLFAPGSGITSASADDDTSEVAKWGTSMASPHVAGAAALYLQNHSAASPADVRAALLSTATAGTLVNLDAVSPNRLLFSLALSDSTAPTVSIASPSAGASVAGAVTLRAVAADDVELRTVRFLADGTAVASLASPPFQTSWNTGSVANGSHTIAVEAVDTGGNLTRRSLSVTVANTAPGPQGWTTAPVGSAGDAGQARYTAGGFVIDAAGSDLFGAADSFYFARRRWTGDGDLVARVTALDLPPGAQFALAGLTFRESLAADSRHASIVLSTDGKVKFRRRTTTAGATSSDGPPPGTTSAPAWLKLSRRGNTFTAAWSEDAITWTAVQTSSVISMPATVEVGLIALRSGGSDLARATFDNVGLGNTPPGWSVADVGAVGGLGTTTASGGVFEVAASGSDLWSTADAFHLAYMRMTGDGEISARVDGLTAPAAANFALAAITMRESLDAGARHASLIVTSDGKAKFRRRTATSGTTASDGPSAGSVSVPLWLRLVRQGQTFAAYISADGVEWQQVHTTQSVALPDVVYVGVLGLRNGSTGQATVRFSNVAVR